MHQARLILSCRDDQIMRVEKAAPYIDRLRVAQFLLLRLPKLMKCFISASNNHHTLSLKENMPPLDSAEEMPDLDSLILILHHCKKQRNPQFSLLMLAYLCDLAAETHPSLGNHLIPVLVECGNLAIAQQVCNKFIHPNEHSCLALIQGYVDCEDYDHAFAVFKIMQERCIKPSMFALQALAKASARKKSLVCGHRVHLEIVRAGCEDVPFVSITLVDMYAKCGSLLEAQEVFDEMKVQDVVAWNALISGFVQHELYGEALECYIRMKLVAMNLDACTFLCVLKACCNVKDLERGREVHAEIVLEGLEGDSYLLSALVDLYAKCGLMSEAQNVFDEGHNQDLVSWNALIKGYTDHGLATNALICLEKMQLQGLSLNSITYVCCLAACTSLGSINQGQELHIRIVKEGFSGELHVGSALVDMYVKCGLLSEAKEAFEQLEVRDAVSWTTLIAGYTDAGFNEEALYFMEQLLVEGMFLDAVTYLCCLKACGSLGSVGKGQKLHAFVAEDGFDNNLFVSSALVDMYAKCGLLTEAFELFEGLPIQDAVAWNSLLSGYSFQGESERVFYLLEMMINRGPQPDETTLLNVLTVCRHAGLIEKGFRYFQIMRMEFVIVVTLDHYSSMIDLLARAGQLDMAVAMLESMCLQPNLVTWTAVLGACQKSVNIELAREAFECAMDVDNTQTGLFLLMLNLYSNIDMTKEEKEW